MDSDCFWAMLGGGFACFFFLLSGLTKKITFLLFGFIWLCVQILMGGFVVFTIIVALEEMGLRDAEFSVDYGGLSFISFALFIFNSES